MTPPHKEQPHTGILPNWPFFTQPFGPKTTIKLGKNADFAKSTRFYPSTDLSSLSLEGTHAITNALHHVVLSRHASVGFAVTSPREATERSLAQSARKAILDFGTREALWQLESGCTGPKSLPHTRASLTGEHESGPPVLGGAKTGKFVAGLSLSLDRAVEPPRWGPSWSLPDSLVWPCRSPTSSTRCSGYRSLIFGPDRGDPSRFWATRQQATTHGEAFSKRCAWGSSPGQGGDLQWGHPSTTCVRPPSPGAGKATVKVCPSTTCVRPPRAGKATVKVCPCTRAVWPLPRGQEGQAHEACLPSVFGLPHQGQGGCVAQTVFNWQFWEKAAHDPKMTAYLNHGVKSYRDAWVTLQIVAIVAIWLKVKESV